MDFVKKYCDMIIEVSNDCKNKKRTLQESILLLNQFTNNLESFVPPKKCVKCKIEFKINWNRDFDLCPKCNN